MFMSRYFDRSKLLPVLLVAGVLLIIGLIVWATSGGRGFLSEPWKGVAGDPINVTLGFYEDWLKARTVGPNEPFVQGLLDYEQVGPELTKDSIVPLSPLYQNAVEKDADADGSKTLLSPKST